MSQNKELVSVWTPFPEEMVEETLELLSNASNFKKGANEVSKVLSRIRRGDDRYENAVIVIASDVEPIEVIHHLPQQSFDVDVPYVLVPNQETLGSTIGIKRTACVAVFDASFSKIRENAAEINAARHAPSSE